MRFYLIVLSLILITGCSSRGAYEGIQASNRVECSKLPHSQYEECMKAANKSYDEYERERQAEMSQQR